MELIDASIITLNRFVIDAMVFGLFTRQLFWFIHQNRLFAQFENEMKYCDLLIVEYSKQTMQILESLNLIDKLA